MHIIRFHIHHTTLINGDLNFHVDKQSNKRFHFPDILSSFELKQRAAFPTHIHAHILDLVICSACCDFNIVSFSDKLSNHSSWLQRWMPPLPRITAENKTIQEYKKVNINDFKTDILNSCLTTNPLINPTDLLYHTTVLFRLY